MSFSAQVGKFNAPPARAYCLRYSQDRLHNSEHTLSSVTVTSPDLKHVLSIPAQPQPAPSESPKRHRSSDSGSSYNAGSSCTHSSAPAPSTWLPTAEDAHTAVPHPNAYYCRKHNCWVLLIWKPSSMHPPLVHSFTSFLLDHSPRGSTNSCIRDGEQAMGTTNITHHFHAYVRAVDARRLTPVYCERLGARITVQALPSQDDYARQRRDYGDG
ncbi:hypothetical protein EI94DRAFT_1808257 [Lactarius quietus]|nr:hypothetical protein EI94DRAFT_1808257 [Lactarius quietus]